MKKVISILLCAVLIFGLFSVSVSAAETGKAKDYKERIFEAIYNMEEEINLDEYDVLVSDVTNFIHYVFQQYPEYHYVSGIKGGTQNKDGEMVTLKLSYGIDKEHMLLERDFINRAIEPVLSDIGKNWSDMQKALRVHDWLCANFMYDYHLFEDGNENHDIYGFLRDGMGVCQSYAYTYMYILRKVGVDAYYVVSEIDSHGWNVVNIDGKWYHVDVTHDDPIISETAHYDFLGEVRHNYFLLSDQEIIADGAHDDFYIPQVLGIVCGEYEGDYVWESAVSGFQEIGGDWYYLDNSKNAGGLMKTKDFKTAQKVFEIGKYVEDWGKYGWAIGNTIYSGYYTGLFEYNEHLFFTDANEIYVYDTHHSKMNTLPVERPENYHYFGLNMSGKTLKYLTSQNDILHNVSTGYYTLGTHFLTDWEEIKKATQTETGLRVKFCYFCGDIIEQQTIPVLGSVQKGDANGDGSINTSDLAAEKLYLAGSNAEISIEGADFDSNGMVNTSDLASLKLYLAGVA